ncbi:MAG: ParB/RepB/Spo0J family partition protein [Bdellovibrionales bacterium]
MSSYEVNLSKKGRLGRGLGSLLGDNAMGPISANNNSEVTTKNYVEQTIPGPEGIRVQNLDVSLIKGNPKQPRRQFDAEKLRELAASIKERGILQPILVRPTSEKGRYEIVAGERRWRAAQLAGLSEVPVLIKASDDKNTLEMALIENIQRADLGPLEEAEAYQRLAQDFKMTQSEIGQKVGKDRTTVANSLRLLELTSEVKEMLKTAAISLGHAKVLLSLPSASDQISLAKEVVEKKLSVRATEKLVAQKLSPPQVSVSEGNGSYPEAQLIARITEGLQKTLGTKVSIDYKDKRGKLVLHFYSDQELNKIVEKLKRI